jgi:Family of unknown function (DUF6152)
MDFSMGTIFKKTSALLSIILLSVATASAHHGSGISYDTEHAWSTWGVVTEFNYLNPHPSMTFDRTDKNGKVEHWTTELFANPSQLARLGWTKKRSVEALAPGKRVKIYLATARVGGFGGVILMIQNENGETIVSEREKVKSVDLDGVPGGYQPTGDDKKEGKAE